MDEYEKRVRARKSRWKKKRRRQAMRNLVLCGITLAVLIGCIVCIVIISRKKNKQETIGQAVEHVKFIDQRPLLDVQLLDVNEYSRPGIAIRQVNGVVVHYTANPGTTAQQNRDYFQGLAKSGKTHASSHFVIGLEGEIIQCIPCNEISYASNHRNSDTISIECCILDGTGKFNQKTYASLVELVSWLMGRYGLTEEDVIRHYDVTGKNCPKYFVENPAAWEQFHQDLLTYIDENGVEKMED